MINLKYVKTLAYLTINIYICIKTCIIGHMQETATKKIVKIKIKEPPKYRVILLNDEETTFDFVMFVLIEIFLKPIKEAHDITITAHKKGSALVGIYTRDIIQSRLSMIERYKQTEGFPLNFQILPE